MKEAKKRKRIWLRILMGALGTIIAAAVAVTAWQWNNIDALLKSRKYTNEQLEQMLEDNEAKTAEILEKLPVETLRPLTEEERDKLIRGEILEDEAVALIMSPPSSQPEDDHMENHIDASRPNENQTPPSRPPQDDGGRRVAEQLARIYILRDLMSVNLESMFSRAKAEYAALPPQEHTSAKKRQIALTYLNEAAALENNCDAQMNAILTDLEAALKDCGGDTGVVSEIRQAYKSEKISKKAYYINKYL